MQVVDAARDVFALPRQLEARRVGELEQLAGADRPANVEIEDGDALQVIGGLRDEHVADLLALRRGGVRVAVRLRRADHHGGQLGHRVGDALGLAAPHRRKRDQHVGALPLRLFHAQLHGLLDARRARPRGRGGPRLAVPHETDLDAPRLPDHHRNERRRRGRRGPRGHEGRRVGRARELRQAVCTIGPVVHAGGERGEVERVQDPRNRLGLGPVLVRPLGFERGIHEEERPGGPHQGRGRARLALTNPCPEMVDPAELVFRTTARLERPGEVGDQVEPQGRSAHVGRNGRRRGRGRRRPAPLASGHSERKHRERRELENEGSEVTQGRASVNLCVDGPA